VLLHGQVKAGDSWERGMGGVILTRRGHPAAAGRYDRYLIASASAANPFSVPGLCVSTVSLSAVRPGWSTYISWEHTGISGYSCDLFELSGGIPLPGGLFHLGLKILSDSRRVAGFGRETVASTAGLISIGNPSTACAELESAICQDDPEAHLSVRAGTEGDFIVISIGRRSKGGRILRAGALIQMTPQASFLTGYDIETGEVSGGVAILTPARMAVSWSVHPVLGVTFSVSVGALR
jgi:hypothetical protein